MKIPTFNWFRPKPQTEESGTIFGGFLFTSEGMFLASKIRGEFNPILHKDERDSQTSLTETQREDLTHVIETKIGLSGCIARISLLNSSVNLNPFQNITLAPFLAVVTDEAADKLMDEGFTKVSPSVVLLNSDANIFSKLFELGLNKEIDS